MYFSAYLFHCHSALPKLKCKLVLMSFLCRVNQDGVFQGKKVCRAIQELQAFQERRVALDCLVFLDEKAIQDHKGLRESKVWQDALNNS